MSSIVRHKGVLLWMLALTIVHQVAYQAVMYRALPPAEEAEADDECRLSGGILADTPLCVEVQMFRTWQQTAPLWHELDAGSLSESAPVDDLLRSHLSLQNLSGAKGLQGHRAGVTSATPAPTASASTATAEASSQSGGVAWTPITQWAQGLIDLQSRLEAGLQAAAARHSHPERPIVQSAQSAEGAGGITPWGQQIVELQKQLEAHREALPSVRRKHTEEQPLSDFDRLAAKLEARLQTSKPSPWAGDLMHLQAKLQSHMDELAASHAARAAGHHSDSAPHEPSEQAEGGAATSLLDHAEDLHRQLCEAPERRHRKVCVDYLAAVKAAGHAARLAADTQEMHRQMAALQQGLANMAAEHAEWERHFDDEVNEVRLELCRGPRRHDSEECRQLLRAAAEAERLRAAAQHAARAALRANITAEAQKRTAALELRLRQMRQEHRVWEKALLERNGLKASGEVAPGSSTDVPAGPASGTLPAAKRAARTSLRQGRRELQWAKVAAWSAKNPQQAAGDAGAFVAKREDVAGFRWAGPLPKVACIAAIPDGHQAQSKLAYFVNNFRLQDYQGPMQLILVYHQKDLAAARLAKQYADGTHVKAVAAWGEGAFPSTAALRYGAWLARDAQVVARWDFDTWYHPQRLSLQVRALAFSTRPGCLLKRGAAANATHAVDAEASLVGEAAWMREFWHPLLEEERPVLEAAKARDIVELESDAALGLMVGPAGRL